MSRFTPRAHWYVFLIFLMWTTGARANSIAPQRVEQPPRIDGRLDDDVWTDAPVADGFKQQRPDNGEPASQPTTVRLVYTEDALYIAFVCVEPNPDDIVRQSLGRDTNVRNDDYFAVVLDTFHDRQNGVFFQVNPNGVRRDALFRGDGDFRNPDWDGVWKVVTLITDSGWQGEIEIPWRTLRFATGDDLSMGVNFERQRRVVNEQSQWLPMERQFSVFRVSAAGQMTSLRGIEPGRNIVVRPYALARTSRGDVRDPAKYDGDDWFGETDAGLDAKWGVTSNLTLDVTVNADFAQVESDDEVVNLTRFPLFFPEKREFFLEKRDFFDFGSPANLLFFSRRIGLDEQFNVVPIQYGARLTGKVGRTDIGIMDMKTGSSGSTPGRRFDVVRVGQDIGQRSRVGAILVSRRSDEHEGAREATNTAYGADAFVGITDNLDAVVYVNNTEQKGANLIDSGSVGTRWRWQDPLYQITYFYEGIGTDYSPAVGFAPRPGVNQHTIGWGFTPEPNRGIFRRSDTHGQIFFSDRRHGPFESRFIHVHPIMVTPGDAELGIFVNTYFERLFEPFDIGPELVFPAGDHGFNEIGFNGETNPNWPLGLDGRAIFGDYFDGTRSSLEAELEFKLPPHVQGDLEWQRERIERDDPAGKQRFESDLIRLRTSISVNNDLGVDLFVQWNTDQERILSQLRVHYLFGDESDVYLVLGDGRADGNHRHRPLQQEATLKVGYARRI